MSRIQSAAKRAEKVAAAPQKVAALLVEPAAKVAALPQREMGKIAPLRMAVFCGFEG